MLAAVCGLGFGLFMAAADATLFHVAIPEVQRQIAINMPLGERLARFLVGALHDELALRLLGMTALVLIMATVVGEREPRHQTWAIVIAAAVLWPLSAWGYLAGLHWSALTVARELTLHVGAGLLWGWLYCRHGWLAAVLGHASAHLALQPLLVAVTLRGGVEACPAVIVSIQYPPAVLGKSGEDATPEHKQKRRRPLGSGAAFALVECGDQAPRLAVTMQ